MPTLSTIPVVLAVAAAGALIVYTAYRRATKRTVHDLRTELLAEQESLCAAIVELRAKIDLAKRSRTAAAHAGGNTGPEESQQWLCELDLDLSEIELLRSQLSATDSDDKSMSDMDVEIKLVEVLALSLRASALAEKYRASISLQETTREETDCEETDCEMLTDEADALMREASRYSLNNSGSPIVESVV